MTLTLSNIDPPAALVLDFSGISHCGTVRERNQDACVVDQAAGLLLVADGVGGQGDGSWASLRAVTLMRRYLQLAIRYVRPRSNESRERVVRAGLEFCSLQMRRKSVLVGGKSSGTTLVGLWAPPGAPAATAFNIGDSSLFKVTSAVIIKISHDHSLHQLWVDGGNVGTEPSKRVITQAIGISPDIHAHVTSFSIAPGDAFVACTDGLTAALSRPEIGKIVRSNATATEGTRILLDNALLQAAQDNVTAAVCKITSR